MELNIANILLMTRHMIKRLLRRFLLLGVLSLLAVYLFITIARNFRLDSETDLSKRSEGYGNGRVSSSLLRSNSLLASQDQTFLVACILSAPSNSRQRQAARDSWMKLSHGPEIAGVNVLPLFVLGGEGLGEDISQTLSKEMEAFSDLLILDNLVDSYANLTLKIIHAYSWIDSNIKPRYVLKMDDDSFARIDLIGEELRTSLSSYERLYWGFFDGRARPFKKGKWSEKTWNLCDLYIPYALGGGYVVSGNLVSHVARNAADLRLFFNEDVAMGTWMAPLDVYRKHDPRFDTEFKSRGCFSTYLVTHKQTADMLKSKYENLVQTGSICGGPQYEFRSRMSYDYNWTVPPSQCCHRGKNNLP